jgi:UDP-galactopyranose mutase
MNKKSKSVLVIGGGFGGVATARLVSELKNMKVTLLEKSSNLGAGVRTNFYGGHPYTFGPRHFLTQNKDVFNYLNKIVPMRSCGEHEFVTYVEKDNQFYNYPLHVDDLDKMPDKKKIKKELSQKNELKIKNSKNMEDYWINSIGKTLYGKTIEKYNKKMWLVDNNKKIDTFKWSPKGATLKSGPRAAWDKAISAYPIKLNGYNDFFDKINKKKIKVILNSKFKVKNLKNKEFIIDNKIQKFDIVVSTISPDFYFNNKFGELPFIGRDFHKIVFPSKNIFPKNVYFLYYANNEKFTRLVEYKKFTKHKSDTTLIGMEIPSKNGKHYPVPFKKEIQKSHKYLKKFPNWFFSIGRAGTYRYEVDIDDCIEQAMEIKKIISNGKYDGPLPLKKWWTYG